MIRLIQTAAVAACLALGVAACGNSTSSTSGGNAAPGTTSSGASSGSSGSSSSGSSSSGSSSSGAPSGAASGKPVTDYLQYVGGKAGAADPKLSPVLVGFLNTQGGAPTQNFPEASRAAQVTVKYINSALGGVHGHPLKLVSCFIASSSSQAQSCAQQMTATKGIDAITYGLVDIGNPAIYSVLKGSIPVIEDVSAHPADDTAQNVYELEGSQSSAFGPYGTFIKQAYPNAKTVAIAYANQPGAATAAQAEEASVKAAGLTPKMLPYSPTASDLVGPATQMEQADIASPECGFVDCPLMAKAIKEIGGSKPSLSSPLWTFLPPPAYGGDLPKWIVGEAGANLAYPADPGVKAYLTTSAKYGLSARDQQSVFAAFAWSNLLVIDKVLNQMPPAQLSPAAVTAKMKQFKGSVPLGPPDVDCSGALAIKGSPNACNDQTQFYQYLGHGQWKQAAGWLKPPGVS